MTGKLTDTTLMQLYTLANRHGYQAFARHAKNLLAPTQQPSGEVKDDPITALLAMHAEVLDQNEYAYFELAYTRRTEWMAWICSNHRDDDPNRKVLARGQGSTPHEACAAAIDAARAQGGEKS